MGANHRIRPRQRKLRARKRKLDGFPVQQQRYHVQHVHARYIPSLPCVRLLHTVWPGCYRVPVKRTVTYRVFRKTHGNIWQHTGAFLSPVVIQINPKQIIDEITNIQISPKQTMGENMFRIELMN